MNGKCVLCEHDCEVHGISAKSDAKEYDCPSCGHFVATREAKLDYLDNMPQNLKQRIAACTRERNLRELPDLRLCSSEKAQDPTAGAFTVDYVLGTMFPSRIQDRFDRVMGNLCRMTDVPGDRVPMNLPNDLPVLFAESNEAARFTLNELDAGGYIQSLPLTNDGRTSITVTAAGIARMQELEESEGRDQSSQVFVAMWFDEQVNGVFTDGIVPAVHDCGLTPFRIDAKETNQKICDEIIAEIRRSRLVVADFTGSRGGVYFEAGFAMGLGIPVIWTCRNTEKDVKALHFDTRQYAHILWNDSEDMREKLRNRIAATIPGIKLVQQTF